MKNFLFQLCVILFLFSCHKKEEKTITGKWIFVEQYKIPHFDKDGDEEPSSPIIFVKDLGFNFYSKDSCEANYVFYEPKSFDVDYFNKTLGRKTTFKIEKDSLKIFNRTLEKWESYEIMYFDENNLILNKGNWLIKNYAKKTKK